MPRFEVDITLIVTADDDKEAYAVAEAAAQNMVCGSILEVRMGGVADLTMAPSTYTEDQIADLAEQASFYVTPSGQWLRIDYCDMDEGYFQAHDEDSHEEYRIEFMDVTFEEQERFHAIAELPLPLPSKTV